MQKQNIFPSLSSLLLATTLIGSLSNGFVTQAGASEPGRDLYRAPTSFAGKTVILPIGTTFEGRIQSTIGSRTSRSGEAFSIEVSAPVMANGTDVLIPSGSEVIGEVAEAISSSDQGHDKKSKYRPLGILRVQISSLKIAGGTTYPLVASFAPDAAHSRRHGGGGAAMVPRKSTVAYVGTQAGFDAVNPALHPKSSGHGKSGVLTKSEVLRDPILGDSNSNTSNSNGVVRSLIRKGRDLYILSGSSITVKLDAPLKLAFAASNAQASMDNVESDNQAGDQASSGKSSGGKHFSKSRQKRSSDQGDTASSADGSQNAPQSGGNSMNGNPNNGQPRANGPTGNGQGMPATPAEQPGSSF